VHTGVARRVQSSGAFSPPFRLFALESLRFRFGFRSGWFGFRSEFG
jgi:hypothetical protein